MKSVAIISEYNPFHNGHVYQSQSAREKASADVVIAIMSGSFTQRGEPAFVSKFDRAKMALSTCDLIVELPQFYAVSYADDFAYGAMRAAALIGADALSFGAEDADLKRLIHASENLRQAQSIKTGASYAKLMSPDAMTQPNNILAVQYIRQAAKLGLTLEFHPVARIQNNYHDAHLTNEISSATSIRKAFFEQQNFQDAVPIETLNILNEKRAVQWEDFYPFLKYQVLSQSTSELKNIYMMTEGLEHRIKKMIAAPTFAEFMQQLKTKRYTYTRLQRLLIYILLGIKKREEISGLRVLAMNEKGRAFIKGNPHLYTNTNKKNASLFDLEIKATQIYNLISHESQNDFNTPVILR